MFLYIVWCIAFCIHKQCEQKLLLPPPSFVSMWVLWGMVHLKDWWTFNDFSTFVWAAVVRRIKASIWDFFFPPKSSLFLYKRTSHFYQPLFSKPWWGQPISILFQSKDFLLGFRTTGSCYGCDFSSTITASSGCCKILLTRLCCFI